MACKLAKGNGVFDAIGHKNDEPTVFIRSEAAPDVVVVAATFGATNVPVSDDGKMKLPKLEIGTKSLTLIVDGVDIGDDIELFEDCPDGEELSRGVVGAAPGGANLRVGFRIHV